MFNDSGNKELFIFRSNNKELLISRNGLVQKGKWELLSISSIIIDIDNRSYLFNTAFVDNKFLALQLDGTNECMIMIEPEMKKQLLLDSVYKVENYLESNYIAPEMERKKKNEEDDEKIRLERIKNAEIEKRKKEELEQLNEAIKKHREEEKKEAREAKPIIKKYIVRAILFSSFIFLAEFMVVSYLIVSVCGFENEIPINLSFSCFLFIFTVYPIFSIVMPTFTSAFKKIIDYESFIVLGSIFFALFFPIYMFIAYHKW